MSQYASDIMMTRPYFSSSNYICKMSDFKKGEWTKIWDALYYSFIGTHAKLFRHNYAIARQVILWTNKTKSEQRAYNQMAYEYMDLYI